jgi:hypothetical protein
LREISLPGLRGEFSQRGAAERRLNGGSTSVATVTALPLRTRRQFLGKKLHAAVLPSPAGNIRTTKKTFWSFFNYTTTLFGGGAKGPEYMIFPAKSCTLPVLQLVLQGLW